MKSEPSYSRQLALPAGLSTVPIVRLDGNIYDWQVLTNFFSNAHYRPPGKIVFFRHGQTYLNRQGRNSGQMDSHLTVRGRLAARKLQEDIPSQFTDVFSSPLSRCLETVAVALEKSTNRHWRVYVDDRLRERSLGVIEGQPQQFIPEFAAGDLDYSPARGESYRKLAQRCLSLLVDIYRLMDRSSAMNPCILVFTHLGPLRVFWAAFGGTQQPDEMMAKTFPNLRGFSADVVDCRVPSFLLGDG